MPFFAIQNYGEHKEVMARAHSLAIDGIIEFRRCAPAAGAHGYKPKDMHGFVEIVPMADAEIIELQQQEGYVYMLDALSLLWFILELLYKAELVAHSRY